MSEEQENSQNSNEIYKNINYNKKYNNWKKFRHWNPIPIFCRWDYLWALDYLSSYPTKCWVISNRDIPRYLSFSAIHLYIEEGEGCMFVFTMASSGHRMNSWNYLNNSLRVGYNYEHKAKPYCPKNLISACLIKICGTQSHSSSTKNLHLQTIWKYLIGECRNPSSGNHAPLTDHRVCVFLNRWW